VRRLPHVSWRPFSGPHISILSSYWSYDLVHQFHPVQDWTIRTEPYPLFPIYTGLPTGKHSACHLLARWCAELFFDPEDGGDTFLRKVGYNSTDYTAWYPRRWYSSKPPLWKPQILLENCWINYSCINYIKKNVFLKSNTNQTIRTLIDKHYGHK
jgi:hypothetical protein